MSSIISAGVPVKFADNLFSIVCRDETQKNQVIVFFSRIAYQRSN